MHFSLPQWAPFQGLALGNRSFSLLPTPSTIFVLYPTILFAFLSTSLSLFANSPPLLCSTNRTDLVSSLQSSVSFPSFFPAFSHLSRDLSSSSSASFPVWSAFLNHSLFPVSFFLVLAALLSPELLCRLLPHALLFFTIFSYPFIPPRMTLLICRSP